MPPLDSVGCSLDAAPRQGWAQPLGPGRQKGFAMIPQQIAECANVMSRIRNGICQIPLAFQQIKSHIRKFKGLKLTISNNPKRVSKIIGRRKIAKNAPGQACRRPPRPADPDAANPRSTLRRRIQPDPPLDTLGPGRPRADSVTPGIQPSIQRYGQRLQ